MSANSHIQWTDHTFNPWRGCRKVAPECANCYITTTMPFRSTGQKHGSVRVRASEATLKEPYKWNRDFDRKTFDADTQRYESGYGYEYPQRPRVFCLSLGDWLDDENIPIEWLAGLLRTIHETPNLDWLLLTKRPQNWRERVWQAALWQRDHNPVDQSSITFMADWVQFQKPPANVWIGVSAGADQKAALAIPAKVHFLSCEPMLKPMDDEDVHLFDWVILGGESGKGARPCHIEWIRDAVEFCKLNSVPVFVKQLGSNPPHHGDKVDRLAIMNMKHPKGGDMDEWPEDLRVREFPTV